MAELLGKFFGEYTAQVIIIGNSYLEILICTLLFCWYFKRRKLFAPRMAASVIFSLAVCVLMAYIRTNHVTLATRFLSSAVVNMLPLGMVFFCFRENASEQLISWCGGIAAQQVSASVVSIVYAAFGVDDLISISFFPAADEGRDWLIYYAMHIFLYVVCSLVFSRKKRMGGDRDALRNVVLLSVFAILFVTVIAGINREYESDSFVTRMVVKALFLVCFLFVLVLRTGIFAQSRFKQELAIMDQLMYAEKKQYENVKNNVDIINMKCHDLKHRLSDLEGRLTETELTSLKDAIKIYDSTIKTGSEILDTILYEKQLVSEKERVCLSCMADGEALSFLTAPHVYSLFANALDNAIDAAKRISGEDKRQISVVVKREHGLTKISVMNYYEGECRMADGLPQTTKADRSHHGYGLKSIRYIASLYGGEVTATADSGIFTLNIVFPPR